MPASDRRVLVTGGAGFIGSHLARSLLEDVEVVVLDNLEAGHREAVPAGARFVQGDLLDEAARKEALRGVDVVYHHAALASVARSVADPEHAHRVNATGTLRLLRDAADAGVRRLVYAGSASAYGKDPRLPKVETMAPEPISPYAASKLAGEHYCRAFAEMGRIETVCLRYFNVFGPGQDASSDYAAAIPRFMGAALEGRPLVVYGDGSNTRDFTFVDDVVRACRLAAAGPVSDGRPVNIATGRPVSVLEAARMILRVTSSRSSIHHEAPRPAEIPRSRADVALAKALLGFEARYGFEEGLARTLEAVRAATAALPSAETHGRPT